MSFLRRVERLEQGGQGAVSERGRLDVKAYTNALALHQGREPEPLTEEELELERAACRRFLDHHIPGLRRDPGWQSPEDQEQLDGWERDTLRELAEEVDM